MKVTYKKFVAYLRELVAEEIVLNLEDDYHSVKPLRVFAKAGSEGKLPSPAMIEAHVTSIVDLFDHQNAMAGNVRTTEKSSLRPAEVKGVIQKYKLRYVSFIA